MTVQKRRPKKNHRTKYQTIVNLASKHREAFIKWYRKTYGVNLDKYCIPCIVKDIMKNSKWRSFEDYIDKLLKEGGLK